MTFSIGFAFWLFQIMSFGAAALVGAASRNPLWGFAVYLCSQSFYYGLQTAIRLALRDRAASNNDEIAVRRSHNEAMK